MMENGSEGENITLRAYFLDFGGWHNFRRNISRSTASIIDVFIIINKSGKSKIDYNWIETIHAPKHDVIQFQISMCNSDLLKFAQTLKQSRHELSNVLHFEPHFLIIY